MALVTTKNTSPKDMGLKTNRLRCMVCGGDAKLLTIRPTDGKPACKECAGGYWGPIELADDAKKA